MSSTMKTGTVDAKIEDVKPAGPPLWVDSDSWIEAKIPTRPWIAPGYILRRSISIIAGTGAAGKSTLMKGQQIALALNLPLGKFHPKHACRVLSYNVEDDKDEEHMRLSAALRHFDKTPSDLVGKLHLCGPNSVGKLVVRDGKDGPMISTATLQAIKALIVESNIDVLYLDPLVELHDAGENDNVAMAAVLAAFRVIARECNIGVVITSHTKKGQVASGDQDAARGGGSIVNLCRCMHTITTMTTDEAKAFNIYSEDRKDYFHVEPAKMNYSALDRGEWFFKMPVRLANDEWVVYARPWEPPESTVEPEVMESIRTALAAGIDGEPYSPSPQCQGANALKVLCEMHGIMGADAQKKLRSQLKQDGFDEVKYTNGSRNKVLGIRAPGNKPDGVQWITDEKPRKKKY